MAHDTEHNLAYHARPDLTSNSRGDIASSGVSEVVVGSLVLAAAESFWPVLGEIEDLGDQVRDGDLTKEKGDVVDVVGVIGTVHDCGGRRR